MDSFFDHDESRLSRIETLWSIVRQAHLSDDIRTSAAQQELLDRYGSAIRRYLAGALRSDDLADELFQEFAFKFLQGDFKSADPQRGKFRSFVKTILFRMVALHFRQQSNRKEKNVEQMPDAESTAPQQPQLDEERFLQSWRDDLLSKTWDLLADEELAGGPPYYSILRTRVAHPAASSNDLAELISQATGRDISSGNARVQVHRARDRFATRLIEIIAETLENPSRENIETELVELRLIDYCRDSLNSS